MCEGSRMTEIGRISLNLPKSIKKLKQVGTAAGAGILVGYVMLWFLNGHTAVCGGKALACLLLLLSLGSFVATLVAAVKHSWWWLFLALAAVWQLLLWGGTYEGC